MRLKAAPTPETPATRLLMLAASDQTARRQAARQQLADASPEELIDEVAALYLAEHARILRRNWILSRGIYGSFLIAFFVALIVALGLRPSMTDDVAIAIVTGLLSSFFGVPLLIIPYAMARSVTPRWLAGLDAVASLAARAQSRACVPMLLLAAEAGRLRPEVASSAALEGALARLLPGFDAEETPLTPAHKKALAALLRERQSRRRPLDATTAVALLLALASARAPEAQKLAEHLSEHDGDERVRAAAREYLLRLGEAP